MQWQWHDRASLYGRCSIDIGLSDHRHRIIAASHNRVITPSLSHYRSIASSSSHYNIIALLIQTSMLWWCDNELYVALSSIHPFQFQNCWICPWYNLVFSVSNRMCEEVQKYRVVFQNSTFLDLLYSMRLHWILRAIFSGLHLWLKHKIWGGNSSRMERKVWKEQRHVSSMWRHQSWGIRRWKSLKVLMTTFVKQSYKTEINWNLWKLLLKRC